MSQRIRVFALGGLDENGKCLFVLEIDQDLFVIEAGLKYPDYTNPGIDAIIPNIDYLKENKARVRAFIITHGHDDQMGALPYVYRHVQAPIYASAATIALIKQYSQSIKSVPNFEFRTIKPTDQVIIAGYKFDFYQTVHSIMDTSGFAVETPYGNIVYTGDFIIEHNSNKNYKHDFNALAKIAERDTLLLMTESGAADKPGYTSPNHRLAPHLALPFQEAKGRIFIALYNQSVYNLEEAIEFSFSQGRKILFYDKETEDYIRTFQNFGALNLPKDKVALRENLLRMPPQDLVILMMAPGEKVYKKIGELSIGENEDRTFKIGVGDTFIVAAPVAPAIEVLATDAIDDLYRSGAHVVNITRKMITSMHAQEEDIKTLISLLTPKYYMPIKGQYVELVANAKLAVSMNVGLNHMNTFLMDNGMVLEINDGKAKVLTSELDLIPTGDVLIDGLGVGDVRKDVITERQQLADDGVIVMGITISKKDKAIIAGPDIQMRGFVFVKDSENVLRELVAIYKESINEYLSKNFMLLDDVKQAIVDKALRYIRRETGKRPVVAPIIVDVSANQ
jgi:ribonuclease J